MNFQRISLEEKMESILNLEHLRTEYEKLSNYLDRIFLNDTFKTNAEYKAYYEIINRSKLHIYRSVWIGNNNFDFFIPSLKGYLNQINIVSHKKFKGLVIEVDGNIHNAEAKMKLDSYKYKIAHDLGIALYSLKNEDLDGYHFKEFVKNLSTLPRLDSRAKNRLWRNIYLFTLMKHYCDKQLQNIFGEKSLPIFEALREKFQISKSKRSKLSGQDSKHKDMR